MEDPKELKSDDVPYIVQAGKKITKIEFHEKLGVIFVGTSERDIFVIDPTLGDILYHTSYQSEHETEATASSVNNKKDDWDFMTGQEKIIVVNDNTIGIRGEYQGIILLDTILQTPVKNSSDLTQIELNVTEAESLCHSLAAVDVSSDSKEVEKQLKSCAVNKEDFSSYGASVKREKWSTVKLELPHSVLKSTFQSIVTELWKKNAYIPQLSISSSILERLNMLLPPGKVEDLPIDKTQMFSESARLNTFHNWPHTEYKWALPEKMAQAGFYHNPASSADDRALCFTCNVCLVSWEPTDEPWSEHERHSPFCPFVRGEHTHNVPLYLSYATAPAFTLNNKSQKHGNIILGKSSFPNAVATAYSSGLVIVWDIAKKGQEAVQFEIKYEDVVEATLANPMYCDLAIKPKEAWVMESDSTASILPESTINLAVSKNYSLTVSTVAVLGVPLSNRDLKKPVPPSIVVGVTIRKLNGTCENVFPIILVYGLSSNAISCEESYKDISTTEIAFKALGTTGTKQEAQVDEDELFVSYMSESDLMSDSVIFSSDMNMSDSSGTFMMESMNAINNASTTGIPLKKKATLPPKKAESAQSKGKSRKPVPSVFMNQKINLPLDLQHCFVISHLLPSLDGSQLIVVATDEVSSSALLVYNVKQEGNTVTVDKQPVLLRKIDDINDLIVNMCLIPPDVDEALLVCVLGRGNVVILTLSELTIFNRINRVSSTSVITSVSYCTSMERLCCGTNTGVIELYSLNNQAETESDSDKPIPVSSVGESVKNSLPSPSSPVSKSLTQSPLTVATMKQLLSLTNFENLKPSFTVNLPSCWQPLCSAQKDRKHPQHLQHHEVSTSTTLSWRLQRNKNSKKEHLFEISLPKSVLVSTLNFKFVWGPIQQNLMGCVSLPSIEVTLYKAKNHCHKLKRSDAHDVDNSIDFGAQLKTNSLPSSNEFLKSINAEVVCGPLDLAQHVDLSGGSGTIVMTSPSLMLNKGRNFYLHIKAKSMGKSENVSTSFKSQKVKTTSASAFTKFKGYKEYKEDPAIFYPAHPFLMSHHKAMIETPVPDVERVVSQSGCDWLHEISISIRQSKKSSVASEESERKIMLTSTTFAMNLLNIAIFEGEDKSYAAQNNALDLLVWIAAVNLCGPPPLGTSASSNYQLSFIRTIQTKLNELVLQGILYANRSTSHKTAKLLVLCIDAVENYHSKEDSEFLNALLNSLLSLLPYTVSCSSAGSLQWYFLLLNRVRTEDLSLASNSLLSLLKDVSQELSRRTDPLHALLRTRFGLYGTPFEPELFEIELPPVTKSYSHPLTYAGLCGDPTTGGSFHLWGLKDVDFRDLLVGNPLGGRWGKVGLISPKQQIHGLLEVEPLHFTLHASSEGTRIEKIDLGVNSSFSAVPFPQPEPYTNNLMTNMPVGEGSKKSEPDKAEQIMMLQKALKMDTSDNFQWYDVADFKLMSNTLNNISELPYAAEVAEINALLHPKMSGGNNVGVLTMYNPHGQGQGSITLSSGGAGTSSNVLYNPYQPTSFSGANPIFSSSVFPQLPYKTSSGLGTSHQGQLGSHQSATNPFSLTSTAALTSHPPMTGDAVTLNTNLKQQQTTSSSTSSKESSKVTTPVDNDDLRLLLSPWQMYVPPQQALVIDRMHSGARRFVVLDFGAKNGVLLTDIVIPSCGELVSLSVDIWLHREEIDGQRLVVASDIGTRSLVICDLQPPPVCRYLRIQVIGRYGMGTTKCRIPVGMFYGHIVLPKDVTPGSDVVEDIACRYQLSCSKLKRQLEPLLKSDITAFDHFSYYLPKGKERTKLGSTTNSDHGILSSYQECITLQQQLNVVTNIVKRLQKSPTPMTRKPDLLSEICTDKIHVLSECLIESLLGISFITTTGLCPQIKNNPLYLNMDLAMCEDLFRNICVLENSQCQLSTCTLMLRSCLFQPWWGKFLARTLKNLFSSTNTNVFPQDRVFILLVHMAQKALQSGSNSSVLESVMELLDELLIGLAQPPSAAIKEPTGFLRSKIDMTLLGWVVMFLCLCLDGTCTLVTSGDTSPSSNSTPSVSSSGQLISSHRKKDKDANCFSSRWDFIQGETALYSHINSTSKSSGAGFKRRIQKKIMATKQKLEELDSVATGLGYSNQIHQGSGGLGTQLSNLGNKLEAIKQKQASIGKNIKLQSSKHFKDLLQIRRTEMYRKGALGVKSKGSGSSIDVEIKDLNINPSLCLKVAKSLGLLLQRMDSTCHSDTYLILSKALARIATSCRPSIPLGAIFSEEQVIGLILTAVGVRQRNWSSSWISHAIMCLLQDILEGEKLFPCRAEEISSKTSLSASSSFTSMSGSSDANQENGQLANTIRNQDSVEDMSVDEIDAVEMDDSEVEDSSPEMSNSSISTGKDGSKKANSMKKRMYNTSISTGELKDGIESTTELRLRMMILSESDILAQALKAPIEIPSDISKTTIPQKSNASIIPESFWMSTVDSGKLLASSFGHIFEMMSSENCSVSTERVLQLWIGINLDNNQTTGTIEGVPCVPLSHESVSALMLLFSKHRSSNQCDVRSWGLAFQALTLVANQKQVGNDQGDWLYILKEKNFPDMILRFISGSGSSWIGGGNMAGPTVCQQFYNFLLRLRELSNGVWTSCLKEILLRVLLDHLSGPFLNTDFPLDVFNKFLDRVLCPDLSYLSASTVINIIEQFAYILHLFVFFPNKISIRSNAESKTVPTATVPNQPSSNNDVKCGQTQNFEHVMFRLVTFMSRAVTLPFKTEPKDEEVAQFLAQMPIVSRFKDFDGILAEALSKFNDGESPKTIADIVLKLDRSLMQILSVLSNPNGIINVLVSGDLHSAFNIMDNCQPTTLVDGVIALFSKLSSSASQPNAIVQPIFRFLSKSPYNDFNCPLVVSETFVILVLKVITKEHLREFMDLKCVESVCDKLIQCTRKFFSSCPSFVSILTQYIGRTDNNAIFGQKKFGSEPIDLPEGLQNMAPWGTITSSNYSAHPSSVLLQATPPHRRARTPVFSYHFLPEEDFLELVILLPCAVLLKEVQIVPHMTTTLSPACPSAVMIEVSRNQSSSPLPLGPPVQCGGLTTINIQIQPEVAQTVLIRLFKPKDSSNLGLSQIRLLGSTTFSEAALEGNSTVDTGKSLEASAHWMYIIDRAISVSLADETLHKSIVERAGSIPDFLDACFSMLMAPVSSPALIVKLGSFIFQLVSSDKEISEQVLLALLGPVQKGFSHVRSSEVSQLHTSVDLLFKLGCIHNNVHILTKWLETMAEENLIESRGIVLPEYVQAVGACIWHEEYKGKTDLTSITTPALLQKLLTWTKRLDPKSDLKTTLDFVICALCYNKPFLFTYLMHSLGFIKEMDCIETNLPIDVEIANWCEEGSIWNSLELNKDSGIWNSLELSTSLMTLGRATQSPSSASIMRESEFLEHLTVKIMDFWTSYTKMSSTEASEEEITETGILSPQAFIGVVNFFAELCSINEMKNWFGTKGAVFWLPILNMFSTLPSALKSTFFGNLTNELESTIITFLSKCCWSHPENQNLISSCLREVILLQKVPPHKAAFLHSMSSFCRRLLIQLLLENEKVVVHIKSVSKYPLKNPTGAMSLSERHPSMGTNTGDRVFSISTHDSVSSLLKCIEPFGVTLDKIVANSDPNRFLSILKKEQGLIEAGLEMIDQMELTMLQASNSAAKDKRKLVKATRNLKPEGADGSKKEDADKAKEPSLILESEEFPGIHISPSLQLATLMAAIRQQRPDTFLDTLVFRAIFTAAHDSSTSSEVSPSSSSTNILTTGAQGGKENLRETPDILSLRSSKRKDSIPDVFNILPLSSTIEVFSRDGGLRILSKYLPALINTGHNVGPQFTGNVGLASHHHKESPIDADWVKIESADDFYDEMMENVAVASTPTPKRPMAMRQLNATPIPPHSMAAFGLFLGLPRFSEVLLGERQGAQCLLRLAMGLQDDIPYHVAKTLPTLPFQVLRSLLDVFPLNSEEGISLRQAMTDIKAIHFILACLAVFTHQNCDSSLMPGLQHELVLMATKAGGYFPHTADKKSDDKSHVYWAKGTGFGTGSTTQSWDIERLHNFKKMEEMNATILFDLITAFIHPRVSRTATKEGETESLTKSSTASSSASSSCPENSLPKEIVDLLKNSCLFPAIAAYLRNDSVLDMANHVPLYKAVLQLLRSLVSVPQLVPLLAPWEKKSDGKSDDQPISILLSKMKDVVDNYSKRLTANSKGKGQKNKMSSKSAVDMDGDEGTLISDIQCTQKIVEKAVGDLIEEDVEMRDSNSISIPVLKTLEERYLDEMKKLQFGFYEMLTEDEGETGGIRFTVSHHYEGNVRNNWARSSPARLKRLAQESVTLSTSLPIAFGSSIFVRCDTDRLDIMKVLITGPAGTPYANGCFEFDVFFPIEYPNAPMMINLETTGRGQRVRFNPNLYTDGKVCLSVLNTWHGRPEERWNPQTSSLLPVLVAIQSLILNAEPYYNEPGYEKSRGSEAGERNSQEYTRGIEIATVEWAILDQIKNISNPTTCFRDVIHRHFWIKRSEVLAQCEKWLENLIATCRCDKPITVFKNNLALLKKEFLNMKPPAGLEDLDMDISKNEEGPSSSIKSPLTEEPKNETFVLTPSTVKLNNSDSLKKLLSTAPTELSASVFTDLLHQDEEDEEDAMDM